MDVDSKSSMRPGNPAGAGPNAAPAGSGHRKGYSKCGACPWLRHRSLILLALFAPAALAAGPVTSTGSVIVSVQGTVDVPAGSNPETVVVVDGTATISGDADTVVVAGGTATLTGATVDSLVVIDGRADLQAGHDRRAREHPGRQHGHPGGRAPRSRGAWPRSTSTSRPSRCC